jgi:penicillin-binding protein-related factor A (putative recombinase)
MICGALYERASARRVHERLARKSLRFALPAPPSPPRRRRSVARLLDWDELPAEVRARIPKGTKLADTSPLLAAAKAQRRREQHAAGASLEDELSLVHQLYEHQKRATIERAHPPTVVAGKDQRGPILRYARGGAAVDFYGTANVAGKSRSVYFDAKSCNNATYAHEPKQLHQIRELVKRRLFGALTFLLIVDRSLGVGYIVSGDEDLVALIAGRELTLREPIYHGEGSGRREKGDRLNHRFLYPHFFAPEGIEAGRMERQDVPRWDWLTRLDTLVREGA